MYEGTQPNNRNIEKISIMMAKLVNQKWILITKYAVNINEKRSSLILMDLDNKKRTKPFILSHKKNESVNAGSFI